MTIDIFRDVALLPDEKIGEIRTDEGRVYEVDDDSAVLVGYIDYDDGVVLDEAEALLGWVDDEGQVYVADEDDVVTYEEGDGELVGENIGHVTRDGKLYVYTEEGQTYVGSVPKMSDPLDGAAALLLFFGYDIDEGDG